MKGSVETSQRSVDLLAALVEQNPNRLDYRREASDVYGAIGITHFLMGDLPADIAWQERALALYPGNPRPLNTMAWDLVTFPDLKQRNPKKAVEAASKAVAAESRNANYWHTLGVAQYRDGQYAAALQSFDKSMILRDGGDGFDWYYVALAHWKLHNSQQAIDYLHIGGSRLEACRAGGGQRPSWNRR